VIDITKTGTMRPAKIQRYCRISSIYPFLPMVPGTGLVVRSAAALVSEIPTTSPVSSESHSLLQTHPAIAHLMIETVKDYAILLIDRKGCLVSWNQGAAQIFGYDSAEITGTSFVRLHAAEDIKQGKPRQTLEMAIASGRFAEEATLIRKGGSSFWASITINPLYNDQGKLQGFVKIVKDITERRRKTEALRMVVEGTAALTGEAFFRSCVQYLAAALQVKYAFITEFDDQKRAETLAVWGGTGCIDNFTYEMAGMPCERVVQTGMSRYAYGVQAEFPQAKVLKNWQAESYMGLPIVSPQGKLIGHLAVSDIYPMNEQADFQEAILHIFAARVGAEIDRMRSQQELQQRETQLRDIYQLVPGVIYQHQMNVKTGASSFPYITPRTVELFELTPAKLKRSAQPLVDIIHPADRDRVTANIHKSVTNHLAWSDAFRVITLSGQEKWIRGQSEPMSREGDVVLHNGIFMDITSQKQAEQELREYGDRQALLHRQLENALEELKRTQAQIVQAEKMSSLGQMVAGIAHEINNPVNFIQGNISHVNQHTQDLLNLVNAYQTAYPEPDEAIAIQLEDLDLEFLNEDLPKVITSMRTGTTRIRDIVKSLRSFSRLDEAELKSIDLYEGLESTLMILQSRLRGQSSGQNSRADIQIVKDYAEVPTVECYGGQINQVFLNLLTNAIDAIEDAAKQSSELSAENLVITIRTEQIDQHWVRVAIADTGIGIPAAIQSRIFDPFFTTKEVGKGTGMGLSICYQVVTEKHRGRLTCQSEQGIGTEFWIDLPVVYSSEA
jgi:PAS domain S-box-containing protein